MKPRFTAKESTTKRDLMRVMKNVKATSLKIEQDEYTGSVKVIFDRNNRRYTRTCSTWKNSHDNLRAIQLSIEYLYRSIEIYGVVLEDRIFDSMFESTFLGLEAPPDDSTLMIGYKSDWFEVLGVRPDSDKLTIVNAFKALAKVHHPDVGGSKEVFIKLKDAYHKGMKLNAKDTW